MAQVFVVVAAGSVIAFIIRDLGEPGLAGWIIQACPSPETQFLALMSLLKGTVANAECSLANCWKTFRCT